MDVSHVQVNWRFVGSKAIASKAEPVKVTGSPPGPAAGPETIVACKGESVPVTVALLSTASGPVNGLSRSSVPAATVVAPVKEFVPSSSNRSAPSR